MARREYSIPVPYTTSLRDAAVIGIGLGMPDVQAALKRVDPEIVAKLEAVDAFSPQTFSRAELDSIPDDLWDALAPYLG